MKPERIQLKRTAGWRLPANTVVVARGPGRAWGNPYVAGKHGTQAECVARYRDAVTGLIDNTRHPAPEFADVLNAQLQVRDQIQTLRGKNLACWCKPGTPCHADVLLELAASQ